MPRATHEVAFLMAQSTPIPLIQRHHRAVALVRGTASVAERWRLLSLVVAPPATPEEARYTGPRPRPYGKRAA